MKKTNEPKPTRRGVAQWKRLVKRTNLGALTKTEAGVLLVMGAGVGLDDTAQLAKFCAVTPRTIRRAVRGLLAGGTRKNR